MFARNKPNPTIPLYFENGENVGFPKTYQNSYNFKKI